jgi:hypothetical protein
MAPQQKPVIQARVSTRLLERAVKRLQLDRYPVHLALIDEELALRNAARIRQLMIPNRILRARKSFRIGLRVSPIAQSQENG